MACGSWLVRAVVRLGLCVGFGTPPLCLGLAVRASAVSGAVVALRCLPCGLDLGSCPCAEACRFTLWADRSNGLVG